MRALDFLTSLVAPSGIVTDIVAAAAIVISLRTVARQRAVEAEMKAIEDRMDQQWPRAARANQAVSVGIVPSEIFNSRARDGLGVECDQTLTSRNPPHDGGSLEA